MENDNLNIVRMHCPNCGRRLTGYKSEDGAMRIVCPRCKAWIFSKQIAKNRINIKVILARQNTL